MLTFSEQVVQAIMEGSFIPALHSILSEASPQKYEAWEGNCCRQTAILAIPLLRELLPGYTWAAWDGWFNDSIDGHPVYYNHAWVFGKSPDGRRLLIDLGRLSKDRLFIEVPRNAYPKDHPHYVHMVEDRRERIDVEQSLREEEFFTGKLGHELLAMVKDRMARK